jgi:exodeoxyribonuclease VII large subunit
VSLFDPEPEAPPVLSVSGVVALLRDVVEEAFTRVVVRGEVSRPVQASSGHLYLTLKEDRDTLPAVMWRSSVQRLTFDVREGEEVTATGRLTCYGPQGRYQLVIESLEPAGRLGALAAAFEARKRQLEAEGLFAPERKQALPFRPWRIALITSPTGAVVHDLVDTILARCPGVHLLVLPVRVQGEGAAAEIAAAVQRCSVERLAEVMVVGRGGGSLEDLWPFNEEVVARAIAASDVPVVSAVGHETDHTIADLVADRRAKTPTAAAFLVVPDLAEELEMLDGHRRALRRAIHRHLERARERLLGLRRAVMLASPRERLRRRRDRLVALHDRLTARMTQELQLRREVLHGRAGQLEALSPLAILYRGYSITTTPGGGILRRAGAVAAGEVIETRLAEGRLRSRIEETEPPPGA